MSRCARPCADRSLSALLVFAAGLAAAWVPDGARAGASTELRIGGQGEACVMREAR